MARAALQRLRVQRFRNLQQVDLEVGARENWIVGANAAGKTALLEAIYCLSRGRSFRGRRFGALVQRGAGSATAEGWVQTNVGSTRMCWSCTGGEVRRDPPVGADLRLPVRLICEWTHALVDGEPALRRRFIDWNLMLYDRRAVAAFSQFRRVAAQRNAWLRSGARGRAVWDAAYAESLAEISRLRFELFSRVGDAFRRLQAEQEWFAEIGLSWDAGVWEVEEMIGRLQEMRVADQERGFTYLGITRADFSFRQDGVKWVGSRGQAKVLGCMLQLAAEEVAAGAGRLGALWLVDDLDAELAPDWSQRIISLLRGRGYQTFYTVLSGKNSAVGETAGDSDRVFHVEHGAVSALARS